jgi:hypothetical protein
MLPEVAGLWQTIEGIAAKGSGDGSMALAGERGGLGSFCESHGAAKSAQSAKKHHQEGVAGRYPSLENDRIENQLFSDVATQKR